MDSKVSGRGRVLAALIAALCGPAGAVIVYDGKIVPAWPDAPRPAALSKGSAGAPAHYYPYPAGTIWGVTLLVQFSDTPPAYPKADVDSLLNQKGFNRSGCNGSVRDYFRDASNGKVDFRNDVRGFYLAKHPKAWYEADSGYGRAAELVKEVLDHFDAELDFSRFDNDGNGWVESISILYAGKSQTRLRGLWPHAGWIDQTRDGVKLNRYMMTDQGTGYSINVFCHECGHMLFGWPDLEGYGAYCLMGLQPSATNPPMINDFYRADQGWLDVVDVDKTVNKTFRIAANGTVGYRFINPKRPQECFFWTNYSNVGRRAALQGRGIFIHHFDYDIRYNTPPKTLSLAVVQADGKDELGKVSWPNPAFDPNDYFSRSTGAAFGPSTAPASNWNDGTASGLVLRDIGPAADTMAFTVGSGASVPLMRVPAGPGRGPRREGRDARGVKGLRGIGPRLR